MQKKKFLGLGYYALIYFLAVSAKLNKKIKTRLVLINQPK